ncbi:hypothetical protein SUGI_0326380 [Cryptomeria japonica]|uniref:uncharacterized protein LOC131074208 n=1 Tax=Cryptomeria japonica TaxID=3369 RepID=UPI002408A3A1|nr:uncharacterized protein LOC131074208 [Cryptomeria japonica]GLJ18418.1 hypothetical protein SUGI_0326380 [Cryptomeria japonica]
MDSFAHNPLTRIPKSRSSHVIQRPRPCFGKTIHFSHSKHKDVPNYSFLRRRIRIRAGLEEIIHNQVLISASVAGFGSQLLKPLVPAALGRGFNWELVLTSGGMPSSHSSSVVAAATAIGLERGFSDSLFGFSVVIAGIIMYDSQGVRRAVGKHAEVINMMIISDTANYACNRNNQISSVNDGDQVLDSVKRELNSVQALEPSVSASLNSVARAESIRLVQDIMREKSIPSAGSPKFSSSTEGFQVCETERTVSSFEQVDNVEHNESDPREWEQVAPWRNTPLKESIGHTKAEVLGGALFGVIVTLGLHSIMQQL